jgi:pectate lyase
MIRTLRECIAPALLALLAALPFAACDDSPESDDITEDAAEQAGGTLGPCTLPAYLATDPSPIGWASTQGGTSGGGAATPQVVTTLSAFKRAAAGTTPAVIYVNGRLASGTVNIGSNKTIIGCSAGARLTGHVELKGSQNVIVRNLEVVGFNCAPPDVDPADGGACEDGQDAMTIEKGARHIWLDHDAFSDGSDGNLDITHGADLITVSYTRFSYSSARQDPNDTGAAGHRFSSLVGGSDSNGSEDAGKLSVTWHHDWWAGPVVERQPRIRFGKNHLFNNLWTSAGNNYCIGAGVGANILSEDNAFVGVKTPIDTTKFVKPSVAPTFALSRRNLFSGTSGAAVRDLSPAQVFVPPYAYTPTPAAEVQAAVIAGAGPK